MQSCSRERKKYLFHNGKIQRVNFTTPYSTTAMASSSRPSNLSNISYNVRLLQISQLESSINCTIFTFLHYFMFHLHGLSPASIDSIFDSNLQRVHRSVLELVREAHIKQNVDGSGGSWRDGSLIFCELLNQVASCFATFCFSLYSLPCVQSKFRFSKTDFKWDQYEFK